MYPIELLVELLFVFFFKAFDNFGLSIAAISILVSLLSLPLYHIAEQLQKKERDTRIRMQPGISRIKSVFKGDEQYMILSTFYRQNHYHPAYALRSSVSLLIQVPFFIAAYHFLSHLPQLQGESFFFIKDLGTPDGLLQIGSVSINVLPILMTIINIVAGAIYTKGFPLRDKIQLYGMAGLFLVLLYDSPSGLVYYWTLNNVFSLVKNIFYKLKHPLKILYLIAAFGSVILTIAISIAHPTLSIANRIVLFGMCVCVCISPLLLRSVEMIYNRYLSGFSSQKKQVQSM
ncbi:YidC/Oxa1 family membrane protein insertase, partial [Sphaerochaeta sp. S2]|uniref:YidC/Oxa1 family membrane protein insertase n=1 Tax=Sphaerochaeta sp. S2 TaxID=2798868 RepID=UPI00351C6339